MWYLNLNLNFSHIWLKMPVQAPKIITVITGIIIIKNECHSNIVDRLQGCGHSKKLREVKVSDACHLTGAVSVVRTLEQFSFQAAFWGMGVLGDFGPLNGIIHH